MKNLLKLNFPFKNKLKKRDMNIIAFCGLFFVFIGCFFTYRQLELLKEKETEVFRFRAQIVNSYVTFFSSALARYSLGIKENINYEKPMKKLEFVPTLENGFTLVQEESYGGKLVSLNNIKTSGKTRVEIESLLRLDAELSALKTYFPEVVWLYYISSENFLYVTPKSNIENLNFSKKTYEKDFWIESVKRVDKSNKTVITSLYDDELGKGKVMTIARPVVHYGKLIGVFAIDLSAKTMNEFLNNGVSIGTTHLYAKDDDIIAGIIDSDIPDFVMVKLKSVHQYYSDGILYLSSSVGENNIMVVHQMNLKKFFFFSIYRTLHIWAILFLLFIVIVMFLRLQITVKSVTQFMNIDSLSGIYNRRGLFSKIERLSGVLNIEGYYVILLDIDFFKNVNDTFGHAVGDHVIKSLGDSLNSYIIDDSSTIYARWGGEEFIIVRKAESLEEIISFSSKFLNAVNKNVITPDGLGITISAGISKSYSILDLDKTIEIADSNLYNAKKSGRKCISFDNNIYNYLS